MRRQIKREFVANKRGLLIPIGVGLLLALAHPAYKFLAELASHPTDTKLGETTRRDSDSGVIHIQIRAQTCAFTKIDDNGSHIVVINPETSLFSRQIFGTPKNLSRYSSLLNQDWLASACKSEQNALRKKAHPSDTTQRSEFLRVPAL